MPLVARSALEIARHVDRLPSVIVDTIQGRDRLFLVPGTWSAENATLVLPMDGSVRLQFQFENQPP